MDMDGSLMSSTYRWLWMKIVLCKSCTSVPLKVPFKYVYTTRCTLFIWKGWRIVRTWKQINTNKQIKSNLKNLPQSLLLVSFFFYYLYWQTWFTLYTSMILNACKTAKQIQLMKTVWMKRVIQNQMNEECTMKINKQQNNNKIKQSDNWTINFVIYVRIDVRERIFSCAANIDFLFVQFIIA